MPAFQYRLILKDGSPADPPNFESSTPTWRPGDEIYLNPASRLRVIAVGDSTLAVERVERLERSSDDVHR